MHVPILSGILEWMDENGMDAGPLLIVLDLLLLFVGIFIFGVSGGQLTAFFVALLPIWLPIALFFIFFNKWMEAVGKQFWVSQGRSTLRITLPQEVFKSPEAMEVVMSQIHNVASPDNLMQTYLDGKRPLPYSFELVSIGGEVRFYVNVPKKKTRDGFEAVMYSQYPGVEIVEEPVDYAGEIDHENLDNYEVMSFHLNKKSEDVFPIKTYIDFGLDKMPKEEEKLDPMTPMIEILASIKPYERLYVQFLCVPHRKQGFKLGQLKSSPTWEKSVTKKVDEIMQRDPSTKGPANTDKSTDFDGMPRLTPGERATIEAMERNASKYAYETSIRWVYITKKGHFNGDLIGPVIRTFSQYDAIGRNGIGVKWRTDFNYKDIIPGGKKHEIAALKKQELKEYKMRKLYPKSSGANPKIFTVEELATVFHLPGQVAMTPSITRTGSTRGEAPANLPVGDLPTE